MLLLVQDLVMILHDLDLNLMPMMPHLVLNLALLNHLNTQIQLSFLDIFNRNFPEIAYSVGLT